MPPGPTDITSAVYEGRTLALSWSGDSEDGRYTVRVTKDDGTPVVETVVAGLSAVLDFSVDPASGYTVEISEGGAPPAGARAGGGVPLVTEGCTVTSAATDASRSVTVAWEPPQGPGHVGGYLPVILWEGTETPLERQPASVTVATFELPASVPGGASIAVRATTGAAAGPIGNAAPILTLAPAGLEVTYDGGEVHASWEPLADVRVDGYDVTLAVSGQDPKVERASQPSCSIAYPQPGGTPPAVTVTVAAATGPSTGPASDPAVDVVVGRPSLSSVAFDGDTVTSAWTAVTGTGVDAYSMNVMNGDTVVASATVAGAAGSVPVAPTSAPLGVTVVALASASTGPPATEASVLADAPTVTATSLSPPAAAPTVHWTPVGDATGYLVQPYAGGVPDGAPVATTATDFTLAKPVPAESDVEVAVAATGSSAGATLTGPYSARARVPSAAPTVRAVDFTGQRAEVEWSPVPGARGYGVFVLKDGSSVVASAQASSGETSALVTGISIDDPGAPYQVIVQAELGTSVGAYSYAVPLYEPGLQLAAPNGVPALYPAPSLSLAPETTTLYLPNLGPLTGLPIQPQKDGSTPPPFSIATNTGNAQFPYKLTIQNGALAFSGSTPIRDDVASVYRMLLQAAEDNKATPWGLWQIQQAISRWMPQTFAETLYYAYGMLPTGQTADLRPGMIVRVAFSEFDVPSATKPPAWSTGYTGSAAVDYEIGDYFDATGSTWLVGFDAFVGWLAANGVVTVPDPATSTPPPIGPAFSESGAADAADMYFSDFRRPFHRIFFPSNLQPTTPPAQQLTAQQFAIAAARTWKDIASATTAPTRTVTVAYFRGRAVAKLCIPVTVNGVEHVVPIGTTVGNLLDRLGRRPPSTSVPLRGVRLERSRGPAVLDAGAPYDAAAGYDVRFDWNTLLTFGPPRDALSLPLLNGDRLTVAVAG